MKKRISILVASMLSVACIAGMGMGDTLSTVAHAASSYESYISVNSMGSGLVIEPTVVFEPSTTAELSSANSSRPKPASVIVTPDANMRVQFGEESSRTLTSLYDSYIKGKFIPVVRLDAETVGPFLSWLKNDYNISDMMAVSDDVEVLETLYADERGYLVNTVYDLTATEIGTDRYGEWPHIAEANKAGCNILMYDGSDENLPVAAEYVEAMTKLCWAYTEDKEEAVSAIAAGCYGVVSQSYEDTLGAVSVFTESGFARAQYIAAHRGITKYANEQSLTGIMAAYNEGATHVEIDIQITADRELVINHDASTARVSTGSGNVINMTYAQIRNLRLKNYSAKYGDTFASLREVCEMMRLTDVILIIELKLDNGSVKAVDELKAIEALRDLMSEFPEMDGHWFCITFYAPYAEQMRELLPQIPVGYLGGGTSGKESAESKSGWGGYVTRANVPNCMKNILRKYNLTLDEMTYDNSDTITDDSKRIDSNTNNLAQTWLARGYAQNTWTFENLLNFTIKCNIATTNTAEACALVVKEISNKPLTLTAEELSSGKVKMPCTTYNGWVYEKECTIIVVSQDEGSAKVLLYLEQTTNEFNVEVTFGLYSNLIDVTIA